MALIDEFSLEEQRRIVLAFREVFCDSPAGATVLEFLARLWHFENPYDADEHSRCKREAFLEILQACGIWTPDNMPAVLTQLRNVSPQIPRKKE
jgi:hypothetical protein